MAVAGLCKASGLDSYINNKERSTTRTSYIRKMWRDLENEGRVQENERWQVTGVITGPESPCLSFLEGESMESENVCPQNQISFQNQQEDGNRFCLQRSPSFDVPEKERLRKIFHEWGSKSFGGSCSRAQWVGENECKRVRIESSSQQGGDTCRTTGSEESSTQIDGAWSSIRRIYGRQALLDLLTKFERERKREVDDLLENRFVSNFGHRHRIQALLKGRFLRNKRFVEDEKQTSVAASELGLLRQTHPVSGIRKGFLSRLNNYDHAPEVAQSDSDTSSDNDMTYDHTEQVEQVVASPVTEIHAVQSHADSDSDSDMEFDQADEIVHEIPNNLTRSQDQDNSVERNQIIYNMELPQGTLDTEYKAQANVEELQISTDSFNWQEVSTHAEEWQEDDDGWYQETVRSDFLESHEEWYNDNDNDNENENDNDNDNDSDNDNVEEGPITESWSGGNHSYMEAALVSRSNNTFNWSDDDDNGRREVELRELTNRRRVSNLLQSDFGARLDQLLMQSYVNRQDQAENGWMQDHHQQQSLDENANVIEAYPQTLGDHDSHHHLATEWEIINGLRVDMDTLQERIDDMQKMLETCMDMQLELQRSMNQEVYSALNRSSNSDKSDSGAFEDCFLCCDDGFERLLDRSTHMYICSKCAQKINWSKLKESVRNP